MKRGEDGNFYVQREAIERRLAAQAVDPIIAKIHEQMAEEYAAINERRDRSSFILI